MRDAKKYLRRVNTWLPCTGRLKKQIKEEILTALNRFLEDHPDADYQAIVAQFGTPQQIAASYVDEMDTPELLHNLLIKQRIVRTVTCGVAAIALIWMIAIGALLIQSYQEVNGYGEVFITVDEIS